MKLYHLSLDCNIKYFYTRIPESRIHNEDEITPRICVAHSLGSCLRGWSSIFKRNAKGGMICALYEFDVEEEKRKYIKPTYELEDLVPDAHFTREVWITNDGIKPTKKYILAIHSVKNTFEGVPIVDYNILYTANLRENQKSDFQTGWGLIF